MNQNGAFARKNPKFLGRADYPLRGLGHAPEMNTPGVLILFVLCLCTVSSEKRIYILWFHFHARRTLSK